MRTHGPFKPRVKVPGTLPRISYVEPGDPWLRRSFVGAVEATMGRRRVERIYHDLKRDFSPFRFFGDALAPR